MTGAQAAKIVLKRLYRLDAIQRNCGLPGLSEDRTQSLEWWRHELDCRIGNVARECLNYGRPSVAALADMAAVTVAFMLAVADAQAVDVTASDEAPAVVHP